VINCTDFMLEIGNYLEGDVAAEVRAQIEGHLAHCRTCQIVYDSARKTLKVLTDCGSFDLPDAVAKPIAERVMARIRSAGKTP
jgi:predicted anti-sigma-YlaC factor YlaD